MKLKCTPEDFQVDERTEFPIGDEGSFAVYRLTKRGLTTPDAIDALARRWKLDRQKISYGGLKDRHALTSQFLTVFRGPRRELMQTNMSLKYLGQAIRPYKPTDIAGNAFSLVMRDMTEAETARATRAAEHARADGVPNYFDDQRFGSVSAGGEFIGRAWIEENYERCLWLALAEPHAADRSGEKKEKQILRDLWGNWPECKAKLGRSHRRSIITFLADRPGDFRGAWGCVRADLRSLYLSAFQSDLWNRIVTNIFRRVCRVDQLETISLKSGDIVFPAGLDDDQRSELSRLSVPLPSTRIRLDPGPLASDITDTLAGMGLSLDQIKVKHHRDSFFSKGERALLVRPADLSFSEGADELYPGRRRFSLSFHLPRGSYATMLVKRLTLLENALEGESEEDEPEEES